jgi:hypothetical protein
MLWSCVHLFLVITLKKREVEEQREKSCNVLFMSIILWCKIVRKIEMCRDIEIVQEIEIEIGREMERGEDEDKETERN